MVAMENKKRRKESFQQTKELSDQVDY